MKKNISTLMRAWISDNKEYIENDTIADYFINDLFNRDGAWLEYFDLYEIEDENKERSEREKEVEKFLLENYSYKLGKQYKFMDDVEDSLEMIIYNIEHLNTYSEIVRLFRDNSNTVDIIVDGEMITDYWISLDIDEPTGKVFIESINTKELFAWAELMNALGNSVYVYVEGIGTRLIQWETSEIGETGTEAINMGGLNLVNLSSFDGDAKEITLNDVRDSSDLAEVIEEDGISSINDYKRFFRIESNDDSTFMIVAYYEC